MVIADNTKVVEWLYKDLLGYLRDEKNGFRTITAPWEGGLEVSVYVGQD
jgi:hypothetical protein